MNWDQAYLFINALIVPGWVLLIFLPRSKLTNALVHSMLYPALMGSIYVAALIAAMFFGQSSQDASMSSLQGVMALFDHPNGIIIGWTHYLVFDLFVGAWISRDALSRKVPYWRVVPALFFTLMFGPVGLLIYALVRLVRSHGDLILETGIGKSDENS